MANILQVTGPSLNPDNRNISDSQRIAEQGNSQKIQNPVDPSRVVRADGQEEGKSGDATGERSYSIIDYESNYGAFIKKLGEGMGLPKAFGTALFQGNGRTAVRGPGRGWGAGREAAFLGQGGFPGRTAFLS